MSATGKTKGQFIEELEQAQRRIAELEAREAERDKVESELRENQRLLRSFVESSNDSFSLWDSELNLVYVNEATLSKYYPPGTSRSEIIGKHFTELVHGSTQSERYDKYRNVLKTGEPLYIDEFIPHPEYGDIHLAIRVFKVKDGLGIITIDITEHKRIEDHLRLSEERYRLLSENIPALICTFLPDSTLTYVNTKYGKFFNKEYNDIVGRRFLDFLPSDVERQMVKDKYMSLTPDKPEVTYEHAVLSPDVGERWMRWTNQAFFDEGGAATGFQAIGFDITERKLAEESLKESEEKFRIIFGSIADGISVIDLSTSKVIDTNEAALHMFNFERDDIIGMDAFELIAVKDRQRAMEDSINTLQTGDSDLAEWCLLGKGGTEHDAEARSSIIYDRDGKPKYMVNVMRDITERKRIYEQLRVSEEKLRRIFESIGDGLTISDLEGTILDVNEETLHLSGYNRDEILGKFVLELMTERDRPRALQDMLKTVENGYSGAKEYSALTKGGREFPAETTTTVLRDADGKAVGMVNILRDITERKRMQEQLRQSEEKLRRVFASIGDAVIITDREGNIQDANEAALRMSGFSREEFIGRFGLDLVADEDQPRSIEDMERTFEEGYSQTIEYTVVTKGDGSYPAEARSSVLYDANGKPAALITVLRDISERKRIDKELNEYRHNLERMVEKRTTELEKTNLKLQSEIDEREKTQDALRESEEKYRTLVEQSTQGIAIMQNGYIVFANDALSRINGYELDELYRMTPEEVLGTIHPDDREMVINRLSGRTKKRKLTPYYDWRVLRKDGTDRWVETYAKRILYKGKPAIQTTAVDITDRKRWEEELKKSKEELSFYLGQLTRAQEEERGRIARELHDDTIQELVTLSRQLDGLIDNGISPEEDRRKNRKLLEETKAKISTILESIRRFTRDLRPSILDDLGLLPALEWLTSEMSKQYSIAITTSISGSERRLDPDVELAMFRIAQEALRNACRHAEASLIQLSVKFTTKKINLVVIDNGKGFSPPSSIGALAKYGKLGLAGMQERAQLHGASLCVRSKPGIGTTISLDVRP